MFNSDTCKTRELIITPRSDWGGEGLLGANIGYGLLHRIPFTEKLGIDGAPVEVKTSNEADVKISGKFNNFKKYFCKVCAFKNV